MEIEKAIKLVEQSYFTGRSLYVPGADCRVKTTLLAALRSMQEKVHNETAVADTNG